MTLHVHTARISYSGPDRLDVTRKSAGPEGLPFAPSAPLLHAAKSGRLAFGDYTPRYIEEMRASWRAHRPEWLALLTRPRVVLCCYCVLPGECHRSLLASAILVKLGAVYEGEVGLAAALAEIDAAVAAEGKLTPRTIADATARAGAELCVVWRSLEARGTLPAGSYERLKARGLHCALRAGPPPPPR